MEGILLGLLIVWPIGYFLALLVTGGVADRWWTKLLQAALGLIVGAGFLWMISVSAENDAREYNNGICTVCGGEYKFTSAAGRGMSRHYYYSCEDCDHTIEVESLQN